MQADASSDLLFHQTLSKDKKKKKKETVPLAIANCVT